MSKNTNDTIFALDIGTRSVVGLLVDFDGETFSIVDYEIAEHKERSMLDGQIHDIEAVTIIINEIKEKLSARNGNLKNVSVAAAGRSLRTKRVIFEQKLSSHTFMTKDDVRSLELAAIQTAQNELAREQSEDDTTNYYCVGYSIVNYYLDDQLIGNLIDQRGLVAKVEIIATFLPRIVVDSLITVVQRAGLSMHTLTLEPIAAINVLIPGSMRKLNIALIDIGAGTSDIAITAEGTVTAYGMVPRAGDEVTEALSQAFLLDFPDAEAIKRCLNKSDEVSFTDVLGMDYVFPRDEIIERIDEEIGHLASQICNKILELNGKPPQAVMLIGGGSLTPGLSAKVALQLNIPPARVAVRSTEAIKGLSIQHEVLCGPEYITPIGIAAAANKHPVKYITVYVNGREIHLFELRQILVGDVLLQAGFDMKRLHGKPGLAMSIKVNGSVKFIPGEWGEPPTLILNQRPVHLDDPVTDHDQLTVTCGNDGKPACPTILDVIEEVSTLDVYLNGDLYSVPPLLQVNGNNCNLNDFLSDRDEVLIRLPQTVQELFYQISKENLLENEVISYTYNGQRQKWVSSIIFLKINGYEANLNSPIKQGDRLIAEREEQVRPSISRLIPEQERIQLFTEVIFNGVSVQIPSHMTEIKVNGKAASGDQLLQDGDVIAVYTTQTTLPIFSDVLRVSDYEVTEPPLGSRLIILINGNPAEFGSKIANGDVLELRWEVADPIFL